MFVTMPVKTPAPLLASTTSMSERELADLRSASEWHEKHACDAAAPWLSVWPDKRGTGTQMTFR